MTGEVPLKSKADGGSGTFTTVEVSHTRRCEPSHSATQVRTFVSPSSAIGYVG